MSADNAGSSYIDGFRRAEIDDVSVAYVLPPPYGICFEFLARQPRNIRRARIFRVCLGVSRGG